MLKHKSGIEIGFSTSGKEYPIEFFHSREQVMLNHAILTYKACRTWPGSWMWEEMVISKQDGIRLIRLLEKWGFVADDIEGAESVENAIELLEGIDERRKACITGGEFMTFILDSCEYKLRIIFRDGKLWEGCTLRSCPHFPCADLFKHGSMGGCNWLEETKYQTRGHWESGNQTMHGGGL